MSNWKKISDFITFSTKGITPKYVENSSIVVLNQKCIRNGVIDYSFSQFTDDTKQISETKFVKKGDILINSTGVGTAGRCAFVEELPSNKRLITDSHILLLRCSNYFEARCLSYLLFSFEKTLMSFMTGSSGQGELDKVVVLNLLTRLPSNSTIQQKISKVLSDVDAKIELNNKINTELEAMAKTLYDYWFVQFDFPYVTSSGVEKPYKSSGGKMVWNEEMKREIPEGWEVKTVDNLLAKESTTTKIPSSEILEYGLIPVIDQSTTYIKGYSNDKTSLIRTDLARIVFGDHTRILKLINFDFARGADGTQVLLSNNERMPQHLFFHSLLKIDLSNYGYARHFKFLKDSKIIVPRKKTAIEFEEVVSNFYDKIKSNIFQNQELAALRDWLLPMLMNGQVTVGDTNESIEEKKKNLKELTDKFIEYPDQEEKLGMVAESGEDYNK